MDGTAVDFALTRFEAVDGARLEVEGTWSGVRGVRFVRPALVVRGASGAEKTLLADLEHKPWPAQEGEPWVAAFPWTGGDEPDVGRTQLAVAPSIVVPLGPEDAEAPEAVAAAPSVTPAAPAVDPAELRALRAALDAARRERQELAATVRELSDERDRLAAAVREANEAPARDREAIRAELRQRDEALAARDEAVAARDAAVAARDAAVQERDALRRELREREQVAEGAARRREQALQERDAARREREELEAAARRELTAVEERTAERERRRATERIEAAEAARAAAEVERDRALSEPAGVVAPPVRVPREHEAESLHADWAARTAAILAVLVLLVLAITFLKAIA